MRCVSVHEAYPRRYLEQSTSLDIRYAPVVRLEKPEGLRQKLLETFKVTADFCLSSNLAKFYLEGKCS